MMTAPAKLLVLASAGVLLLAGCHSVGGGPTTEKSYGLAGFDRISASAGLDVIVKQGPFDVSVRGPKDGMDRLIVELDGSTLKLSRKTTINVFGGFHDHYVITVSAPTLTGLHASSGSDLVAEGITFADLEASVSSGADMKVSGACKSLNVDVSSGADFKGDGLKCETVEAEASSGADALVYASAFARGHASSGADIKVLGHPANFDHSESSGGSVRAP